jgi:hypothetical protein
MMPQETREHKGRDANGKEPRRVTSIRVTESVCGHCLRWTALEGGRLCLHGNGHGLCAGGGELANDSRRSKLLRVGGRR